MTEKFNGDYISWLGTFYQLAELRSFSRVADVVGKSQSTITYHIKKLEERLGVELVNRRATPIELTADGEQLYRICQQLFRLLQQISDEVGVGGELAGDIVIAANYGLTTYYLPSKVWGFNQLHPNVNVEIRPQPIGELVKAYHAPDVDMLITQRNVLPEGAQIYPLFEADMALVAPADWQIQLNDPPRIEDFAHLPFVAFWRDYPLDRDVEGEINRAGYALKIVHYASFFMPILMHVSLGKGVCIMDEYQARTPGFNVKVYPLTGLFSKRVYVIGHKPKQYLSPAARHFIKYLTEHKEETKYIQR